MQFNIDSVYTVSSNAEIELPINDWSEVKQWYVKWNIFHYVLEGDTEFREIDLGDVDPDGLELKRPEALSIHRIIDDVTDYDNPIVQYSDDVI